MLALMASLKWVFHCSVFYSTDSISCRRKDTTKLGVPEMFFSKYTKKESISLNEQHTDTNMKYYLQRRDECTFLSPTSQTKYT